MSLRALLRRLLKSRTTIAVYSYDAGFKQRDPVWNYEILVRYANFSPIMRMIRRAITQEVLRPPLEIRPRFALKCVDCGSEYGTDVERCTREGCGSTEFIKPDPRQRQRLVELLERPNSNYTFRQILQSLIFYNLAVDDYYLSISYSVADVNGAKILLPAEINVEDPRYIRIMADEKGNLGSHEYFCPLCYTPDVYYDRPGICPKCGAAELQQTAYKQVINGQVKARFSANEIVHGATDRVAPDLYGTPKLVSVWKLLVTLQNMDEYNVEVYGEGKLGSILNFPGHTLEDLAKLKNQIKKALAQEAIVDVQTGLRVPSKKIHTLFLASKQPITRIPIMEDLKAMQSLEFYKLYREIVCAVYGVTPVFVSIIESGKAGNNPRMQIDVNDRTVEEIQASLEDVLNNQLLPRLGISHWIIMFKELDVRDELRRWQIERLKADTARAWLAAGFDVSIDGFTGELKVSSKPTAPPSGPPPEARAPVESDASGTLLEQQLRVSTLLNPMRHEPEMG